MLPSLAVVGAKIRALFAGRQMDAELDEEIAAHLEMLARDHEGRGLPPDEARRQAILRFGGVTQVREQHRGGRAFPSLESAWRDISYAVRSLARHRLFAAVAVLTLAIGIGAATLVLSVAGTVLLRPLPYPAAGELVRIFESNPLRGWSRNIASPANYADWRAQNRVFTDIAAYEQFNSDGSGASDVFLTGFGEPQPLKALSVTGNLFSVLGTPPLLGRTFIDEETFEGKARVVVISHALWRTAFGADPLIVGRSIVLSARSYEVVGVMPASFFFPGKDVQAWLPVAYAPAVFTTSRRPHWLGVVARLRPGVSLAQAQQNMTAIARELEQRYPDTNTSMGVHLEGLHESLAFEPAPAFRLACVAVAILFLMICVNTANLQLGRGLERARELAIRGALGAERGRLVRQLLTESLVLAIVSGAVGLGLAAGGHVLLQRLAPSLVPIFADVTFDNSVVALALGLTLLATALFGVAPALSAAGESQLNLRAEIASRRTGRVRGALIASEVALSLLLAVAAVLLARSLIRLESVEPGFQTAQAIAFTVTLPTARYSDPAARHSAFVAIEKALADDPSITAVGAVSRLPLRGADWTSDGTVEGRDPSDFERELRHKSVTPGYFRAAGVPLLAGRFFDEHDTRDTPRITIVNQALAARYFRGEDPIGRRIRFGRPTDTGPWITIVGVVANEKQDGLERPAEPEAFVPITQQLPNPLTFVMRSALPPQPALALATARVKDIDKDLALTAVTTLADLVATSTLEHKVRAWLIGSFAAVALLLAALGIYGVLAYSVSTQAREIGVRLALGALPLQLMAGIVARGLRPVAAGAVLGLAGAIVLTRLVRSLLFGVDPLDPAAYVAATAALALLATTACVVPAWRAVRADPLASLRQD